ncbi:hypothetical protein NPIL_515151 [Nephila pilipes]|uniref:Uncharacterized protein n=1 Tax=Nephila pilipes TaxID=299642 RepID=A0A8X6P6C6_NEPPI|nr:hypothetical protein NPIL_515151 [Nephila pilipes]
MGTLQLLQSPFNRSHLAHRVSEPVLVTSMDEKSESSPPPHCGHLMGKTSPAVRGRTDRDASDTHNIPPRKETEALGHPCIGEEHDVL